MADWARYGAYAFGPGVGRTYDFGVKLYESLFGGGPPDITEAQRTREVKGIRQTVASYGQVLPLVFGSGRLAPSVIVLPSESFVHQKVGNSDNGNAFVAGYSVGLALAAGPIKGVGSAWRDGVVYGSLTDLKKSENAILLAWGMSPTVVPPDDWDLYLGTLAQTPHVWPDPFPETSADSSQYSVFAYPGTAWIAHSLLMNVGEGAGIPAVPNLQFEIKGMNCGSDDRADPIDVLTTLMTDSVHGAGLSLTDRGHPTSWGVVSDYATAMGFRIGWVIEQQGSALDLIRFLLDAINCSAVDSGGRLKLIPYGDTDITANGATYTANVTPDYDLDDDAIICTSGQQPIRIERRSERAIANCVPCEYLDGRFVFSEVEGGKRSASAYEKQVVESPVMSDVGRTLPGVNQKKGLVRAPTVALPCFVDKGPALIRSRIYAQRSMNVRCRYTLRMSWKGILLEKGDLVGLSSTAMGLSYRVCRVTGRRRDRSAGEQGEIELTLEDAPPGTYHAAAYELEEGDGGAGAPVTEAPTAANAPVIFLGPRSNAGERYAWIASAGDATFGGADVWTSWDGTNYELAGRIPGSGCTYGVLAQSLATAPAGVDATHHVYVTLTNGSLPSYSAADRNALKSACWINGEIIAYGDSTGSAPVNLSSLLRGVGGTMPDSHSQGESFVKMDDAPVRVAITDDRIGQTLYVKALAINRAQTITQALADVTATEFPIGVGWGPVDRKLTPSEKTQLLIMYREIVLSATDLDTQADLYGVSHAAFDTAVDDLVTYMIGLGCSLGGPVDAGPSTESVWVTTVTEVSESALRAVFATAYEARESLRKALGDALKTTVDSVKFRLPLTITWDAFNADQWWLASPGLNAVGEDGDGAMTADDAYVGHDLPLPLGGFA